MYKHILKALSCSLLCCFLIPSCASSSSESATSTVESSPASNEKMPLSLQGFSSCGEVLCWNGIIPGVTTFDDAKSIIEGMYERDAIRIGQTYIDWEAQVSDSIFGGSIKADSGGVTTKVRIAIRAEKVAMSEVSEWIGEPDLVYVVRAFSSEARCAGSFVTYSDPGVMVDLYPENHTIGISPTQFVAGISLVPPETLENWTITDTWVIEWQGYTDYCAIAGQ